MARKTKKNFQSRLERLEVLFRVSDIVNTTLDPQRVLKMLLREVVRFTGATSGSISMLDSSRGVLNIVTAFNVDRRRWQHLKLSLGVGVTGYVAWSGKPLRVADVRADPHYIQLKANVRSELAVPLIINGRVIGVINVDSSGSAAFREEHEELLMAVASQSAKVIETARLHERVKRHADELEALFTVGRTLIQAGPLEQILDRIVEEGLQLLSGKVCVLLEVDGDKFRTWAVAGTSAGPDFSEILIEGSLMEPVVRDRDSMVISGLQSNPAFRQREFAERENLKSAAAVPVAYQSEVRAVLAVYSEEPTRFREVDVKLLQLLANQGALAIENARRLDRVVALEDSVRQTERLTLLGTLAAEIAHEIRNPITIIHLLIHGIREQGNHDERTQSDLATVIEKLDRINLMVERTLSLARTTESRLGPVNINALCDDLLLFLQPHLHKQRIELVKKFRKPMPDAQIDEGQIQQVFLNIMVNALQATGEGGRIKVSTKSAAENVTFVIEDTGKGIPAADVKNLFDPFFTRRNGGTGLGLFICEKLVRGHKGTIKIKSTPGEGSRFTVSLPKVPPED